MPLCALCSCSERASAAEGRFGSPSDFLVQYTVPDLQRQVSNDNVSSFFANGNQVYEHRQSLASTKQAATSAVLGKEGVLVPKDIEQGHTREVYSLPDEVSCLSSMTCGEYSRVPLPVQ
jgi:hypothetical protein